MKKILIIALMAGLMTGTNTQAETLNDAIQHTLNTNPQINAIRYSRLARDQEIRQAKSGYYPKVDFRTGIGINDVYSPSDYTSTPKEVVFTLRQNIFNGFITDNEVARQKERVRSEAFKLLGTSESLSLRVAEIYLDVLRHEVLNGLATDNLTIHERIFDQIKLRTESGVDNKANFDHVTGRLALAQSNMVITEINVNDARTNYHAVVDHFPKDLVLPAPLDSLLPATLDDAQQTAVENHPVLKSAQADLDARIAQYKVANGAFSPVIDLEIDKNWEQEVEIEDWKNELEAMLRLRFNIFNGNKDDARKIETLNLICEARSIRDYTHRQVVESIRLSWMAYKSAQNKINLIDKYVQATHATSEAFTKQWNIGKRTMLDVLDTKAEFINAQKDLINAQFDHLYAQYRILSGMGLLIKSLGFTAPEETIPGKKPEVVIGARQQAIIAAESEGVDTSKNWKTEDSDVVTIHSPVVPPPAEPAVETSAASPAPAVAKAPPISERQAAINAATAAGIDTSKSWKTVGENGATVIHSPVR